jgi:hypothetical protein
VIHGVAGVLSGFSNHASSFQALALASLPATNLPFRFRGNRASRRATYHSLHSHHPLQPSPCIAGTGSPSSSHISANWCHINTMLHVLRTGLRFWFAEASATHPHQVPHGQCCESGDVYTCSGGCSLDWVGDFWCDLDLECYCEEKASPACGGKPPVTVCSARCARCQHPYSGAGELLQGHEVIHGVGGVLCGP